MSQTLSQRLGLHNAVPYVTAKQREHAANHARDAAAQRRQRIRAAVARRAAAVLDTVKHAWHVSAPWVAALCLVVAIGAMQIADSQGARLAAVTAERDALRAVNQPGSPPSPPNATPCAPSTSPAPRSRYRPRTSQTSPPPPENSPPRSTPTT